MTNQISSLKHLMLEVEQTLHYGPSTKPLWEAVVAKIDELDARVSAIEAHPALSGPALDPELIEEMQGDWVAHKQREAERAAVAAQQAAAALEEKEKAAQEAAAQEAEKAAQGQAAAAAAAPAATGNVDAAI